MLSSASHLRLQPAFGRQQATFRARSTALRVLAGKLSPDVEKAAIERQLKRSKKSKKSQAKAEAVPYEEELAQRQAEARKWVQGYLERVTAETSAAVQADLRGKPLLPDDVVAAALERQHQNAGAAAEETGAEETPVAKNGTRFDPCAVYDDGTLLYTSSALVAISYEDVLTG